jgi:PKD repeat protein
MKKAFLMKAVATRVLPGCLAFFAACGITAVASAQTETLRIVTYNIEDDVGTTTPLPGLITPSGGGSVTNGGVLEGIGEEILGSDPAQPIDILALEETTSNPTTVAPIVSALNAYYQSPDMYAMSPYQATESGGFAGSGNGPSALIYNTTTVQLLASVPVDPPGGTSNLGSISGEYREVMRYEFAPALVTPTATNTFYIYVSHYKASAGAPNTTYRAEEAAIIRNDEANNLPANARVLYVGDYNISSSDEASYQTIVAANAPNGTPQGQGIDPFNPSGATGIAWDGDSLLNMKSESATDLRYRDDLQIMTSDVYNGVPGGLALVPGTYHTFGNNGTTPYQGSVNSGSNTALNNDLAPGAPISASQLYQDLATASDHLPVVADYTIAFVRPPQVASFYGSPTFGEEPLTVTFTDRSTGDITNWFWDFGNGTTTNFAVSTNPTMVYTAGTYTVTEVVTGPGGVFTNVRPNYITVVSSQAYIFHTLAGVAGSFGNANGVGSAASFDYPCGVVADSAGNVYVADYGSSTIRKITPGGMVSTLAGLAFNYGSADGTGSAARFEYPFGVAADSVGNVYVADTDNYTIRKITPDGVVTTLAGLAGNYGSADGTGSAARFYYPYGLAADSGGNVYVADTENSTIRKVTPDGVVTTLAGLAGNYGGTDGTNSAARFSTPTGVAVDSAGNVYVADYGNSTIRKVTPVGTNWVVSTLAGLAYNIGSADGTGSAARFYAPFGVAVDSAGNVYVADMYNDTIRKITPGGVVSTLGGLAGSSGSADGTGSAARFYDPFGVAVDGAGDVYVADTYNSTIRNGFLMFITAAFTATPTNGVDPLTVTFTDTSMGTITNRFWDFGDGSTTNTTSISVAHTYAAGIYTVTLVITGPAGVSASTQSNYVAVSITPPTASFNGSPTNGTDVLAVTFTDTSTGGITNRFWDFGDGGTTNTTTNTMVHTYTMGTYTVTLLASGPTGVSTNTKVNYITVAPASSIITVDVGDLFDGFGTLMSGSGVGVLVADTGNNGFVDPQPDFPLSLGATWGTDDRIVGLWDPNGCGCGDGSLFDQTVVTYTNGIAPGQKLQLYWFPSLTLASNTVGVTYYGKYTDTNSPPLDGSDPWQMPPGESSAYLIFWTASYEGSNPDAAGFASFFTAVPPSAAFTTSLTNGVAPLAVTFTDNSTGTISNRFWDFGDGATSNTTATNLSHTYSAGVYTVTLIASGSAGASTNIQSNAITVLTPFAAWQTQYFGCTNCPQAAADADPLGKGMNNAAQFLAGLNPTNSASVLRIISVIPQGNDIVITWTTAGGRTNVVQATAGDASGGYATNFLNLSGLLVIDGSGDTTANYIDVCGVTNSPARFYRVRLVQ